MNPRANPGLTDNNWLSRDPLGLVNGPNPYTYVGQNPWTKFDPLGLQDPAPSPGATLQLLPLIAVGLIGSAIVWQDITHGFHPSSPPSSDQSPAPTTTAPAPVSNSTSPTTSMGGSSANQPPATGTPQQQVTPTDGAQGTVMQSQNQAGQDSAGNGQGAGGQAGAGGQTGAGQVPAGKKPAGTPPAAGSAAATGATPPPTSGDDDDKKRNPAKDKRLSNGEIKKLKDGGVDPHDVKPNSKYDLFKDPKGNIYVKPMDGSGPGDPIYHNINDF